MSKLLYLIRTNKRKSFANAFNSESSKDTKRKKDFNFISQNETEKDCTGNASRFGSELQIPKILTRDFTDDQHMTIIVTIQKQEIAIR